MIIILMIMTLVRLVLILIQIYIITRLIIHLNISNKPIPDLYSELIILLNNVDIDFKSIAISQTLHMLRIKSQMVYLTMITILAFVIN